MKKIVKGNFQFLDVRVETVSLGLHVFFLKLKFSSFSLNLINVPAAPIFYTLESGRLPFHLN